MKNKQLAALLLTGAILGTITNSTMALQRKMQWSQEQAKKEGQRRGILPPAPVVPAPALAPAPVPAVPVVPAPVRRTAPVAPAPVRRTAPVAPAPAVTISGQAVTELSNKLNQLLALAQSFDGTRKITPVTDAENYIATNDALFTAGSINKDDFLDKVIDAYAAKVEAVILSHDTPQLSIENINRQTDERSLISLNKLALKNYNGVLSAIDNVDWTAEEIFTLGIEAKNRALPTFDAIDKKIAELKRAPAPVVPAPVIPAPAQVPAPVAAEIPAFTAFLIAHKEQLNAYKNTIKIKTGLNEDTTNRLITLLNTLTKKTTPDDLQAAKAGFLTELNTISELPVIKDLFERTFEKHLKSVQPIIIGDVAVEVRATGSLKNMTTLLANPAITNKELTEIWEKHTEGGEYYDKLKDLASYKRNRERLMKSDIFIKWQKSLRP